LRRTNVQRSLPQVELEFELQAADYGGENDCHLGREAAVAYAP